jgi:hypothetical protein
VSSGNSSLHWRDLKGISGKRSSLPWRARQAVGARHIQFSWPLSFAAPTSG